jgi:hypothetical protein
MKKRPELKVGDVCKLSKKSTVPNGLSYRVTMVVTKVGCGYNKNSSDGSCLIECSCRADYGSFLSSKHKKFKLRRRDLWFTGYNSVDKNVRISGSSRTYKHKITQQVASTNATNNNGRTHCLKCGEPTKSVSGALSDYQLCKNKSCSWYDN